MKRPNFSAASEQKFSPSAEFSDWKIAQSIERQRAFELAAQPRATPSGAQRTIGGAPRECASLSLDWAPNCRAQALVARELLNDVAIQLCKFGGERESEQTSERASACVWPKPPHSFRLLCRPKVGRARKGSTISATRSESATFDARRRLIDLLGRPTEAPNLHNMAEGHLLQCSLIIEAFFAPFCECFGGEKCVLRIFFACIKNCACLSSSGLLQMPKVTALFPRPLLETGAQLFVNQTRKQA